MSESGSILDSRDVNTHTPEFEDRWGLKEARPESEPKIIVEIGCNNQPVVASPFRTVYNNERHIGIDPEGEFSKKVAEIKTRRAGRQNNFEYRVASFETELAKFNDNSIDELICHNVIGDPRFTEGEKSLDLFGVLIRESERVLKNNGKIIFVEDFTPQVLEIVL